MIAYSTNRPIGLGTWPSQHRDKVVRFVHFDHLTYVPEIRHNSFGYIEFSEDIPKADLDAYELRIPEGEDKMLEKIGSLLAGYDSIGDEAALEKAWGIACDKYGYTDDQIGDAMVRHMN